MVSRGRRRVRIVDHNPKVKNKTESKTKKLRRKTQASRKRFE